MDAIYRGAMLSSSANLRKIKCRKTITKGIFIGCGKNFYVAIWHKKTTVDDIVKEANIAKGTFYLYFNSKEDLKNAFQKFFENFFNTPEIAFYFREHKEIDKLTEKFSKENYTNTETDWIRKLLVFI